MTTPALLALAREAPADALPALLGALEEARAVAWARLTAAAARPPELKLLTVDEAAELARVPKRRVFSLARSAAWAVRVGRRLLVEESGFLHSLRAHVRGEHESARTAGTRAPQRLGVRVRARQSHGGGLGA